MSYKQVGKRVYSHEVIVRAFGYFATSRSVYSGLHLDWKLPYIQSVTCITSKLSKLEESNFLFHAFNSYYSKGRVCFLIYGHGHKKKH